MATWKSRKSWDYDEHQDGCSPGKVSWEYQTTADVMTLKFSEEAGHSWGGSFPAREYQELYGPARVAAMLRAFLDWDRSYCEGSILNSFLKEKLENEG